MLRGGFVISALLLVACNKAAEPERGSAPVSTGASAPAGTGTGASPRPAGAREVVWEAPANWTKAENTSPMRKATYRVPRAAGDSEDAELTVSQAGGSVEQNIARWAGQLGKRAEDAKREKQRVAGLDVTVVDIRGDYAGMAMPGAPPQDKKAGWALTGAIVETTPPTFFKLTGPEKTVVAARADFDRFIASLRAK
ncbi:Hypothetical protein A7982_01743 [Minicystis rosea]|nr:Hypothetical protein A7982_01743 [Minicystis rosea]